MYVYAFELKKKWIKKVIVVCFSNQIKKIFQAFQLRVLKAQRQIWGILQGASSLGVKFTRKILGLYDN